MGYVIITGEVNVLENVPLGPLFGMEAIKSEELVSRSTVKVAVCEKAGPRKPGSLAGIS